MLISSYFEATLTIIQYISSINFIFTVTHNFTGSGISPSHVPLCFYFYYCFLITHCLCLPGHEEHVWCSLLIMSWVKLFLWHSDIQYTLTTVAPVLETLRPHWLIIRSKMNSLEVLCLLISCYTSSSKTENGLTTNYRNRSFFFSHHFGWNVL